MSDDGIWYYRDASGRDVIVDSHELVPPRFQHSAIRMDKAGPAQATTVQGQTQHRAPVVTPHISAPISEPSPGPIPFDLPSANVGMVATLAVVGFAQFLRKLGAPWIAGLVFVGFVSGMVMGGFVGFGRQQTQAAAGLSTEEVDLLRRAREQSRAQHELMREMAEQ